MAQIAEHAPGLRTFVLEPERPVPRFLPGQFLHLALDPWDPSAHWPESRAFSIASAPEDRSRLEITVSEVGRFTGRLMKLGTDAEVWVKLPLGEFVVHSSEGRKTMLVAGGTGVAPYISLLRSHPTTIGVPADTNLHVLYGARSAELLIHRKDVEMASVRWKGLTWQLRAEQGAEGAVRSGRLSGQAVLDAAGAFIHMTTYYLSGPPAMIDDVRGTLSMAGVLREHIITDSWS